MTLRLATCLLPLVLAVSVGCVHVAPTEDLRLGEINQRVVLLEGDFVRFTGEDLTVDDEGRARSAEDAVARLEASVAELQRLRLRYLRLLDRGADADQSARILLRIAELHLDLAARGRRLPYPAESTPASQARFDARLGRIVAPLEAAGLGVLEQIARHPADRGAREVRRARLYLALHREGQVGAAEAAQLRVELLDEGPFAAPRRLLEAGRVGRRASRR